MTSTITRACYFVRYASAVHGGPIDEPVYATSPAEALAIFTAQGPAVQVLSVGGPDFIEYDVADLIEQDDEQDDEQTVIFTRTETGATEHIAARNVTEQEAADLIAALLRFPHITAARTR